MKGVVSKETVVLSRWGSSIQKVTLARYRDLSDLLRSPIVSHVPPQMSFIA